MKKLEIELSNEAYEALVSMEKLTGRSQSALSESALRLFCVTTIYGAKGADIVIKHFKDTKKMN